MCLSACEVAIVSPRQIYGAAPPLFVVALFRGIVTQLQPTVRQFIEMGLQVCRSAIFYLGTMELYQILRRALIYAFFDLSLR